MIDVDELLRLTGEYHAEPDRIEWARVYGQAGEEADRRPEIKARLAALLEKS
ncbi:hypothetical protein [Curtobacterium sp. MCSS17_015]|uniref:hypothetical protein n=1 Tax=Curtobacterium sp. MCSS17_015 TaxID=2175666 RepID=UPI0015E881CE|nr:hypothetical protein [Curtobacterium sp. MCSS17_015]WIB25800.1 hypothetical protein DEJ18_12180 [Curtobacterium sp. MCSS17_015]